MFFKRDKKVQEPIKKPVSYEIVRSTYRGMDDKTSSCLYVREKINNQFYSHMQGHSEIVTEVSLPDLLTRILNSLEALGIEIVQTPASSASMVFKKAEEKVTP